MNDVVQITFWCKCGKKHIVPSSDVLEFICGQCNRSPGFVKDKSV